MQLVGKRKQFFMLFEKIENIKSKLENTTFTIKYNMMTFFFLFGIRKAKSKLKLSLGKMKHLKDEN